MLLEAVFILILAIFVPFAFIPRLLPSLLPKAAMSSSSSAYARELQVAQLAVQRAAILTKRVFHEKAKGTVDKNDKSPVTIGDFGAQALIIAALRHHFPEDAIVAGNVMLYGATGGSAYVSGGVRSS
jgi:3'(2'), 5'-bisphosphate nucleotidase